MNPIRVITLGSNPTMYERIRSFSQEEPAIIQVYHCKTPSQVTDILEKYEECILLVVEPDEFPLRTLKSFVSPYRQNQVVIAEALGSAREITPSVKAPYDITIPTSLSFMTLQSMVRQVESLLASRSKRNLVRALRLFARELAGQLDQISHLTRKGYRADISKEVFANMCGEIQHLDIEERAQFFMFFFESCQEQPPWTGEFEARLPYVGVSNRVRKKLSRRAQGVLDDAHSLQRKVGYTHRQ